MNGRTINWQALRLIVRSHYDIQKLRIAYELRLQDLVRNGVMTQQESEDNYGVSFEHLRQAERALNLSIKHAISGHPAAEWAMTVRGIAHTLAGAFVAEIGADRQARISLPSEVAKKWAAVHSEDRWVTHPDRIPEPRADSDEDDTFLKTVRRLYLEKKVTILEERSGIACFDTPAQLFSYAGLNPVKDEETGEMVSRRRKRGEVANWNGFLKTLGFKMTDCWIKSGGWFRSYYDREKEKELAKTVVNKKQTVTDENGNQVFDRQEMTRLHADRRARRKAIKLFYGLFWEVWRRAEGLPTREPFAMGLPGHTTRIYPNDVIDLKKASS